MSEPRFIVTELSGFEIKPDNERYSGHPMTSYYVQDTLYNYAVVRTYERRYRKAHVTLAKLREAARAECARLNEWWEYERKRG